MNGDVFKRAKARLERAWNEAKYRYERRTDKEKGSLLEPGQKMRQQVVSMVMTFNDVRDSPCAKCSRCCTQAAFSSGFHSHTERESILAAEEAFPDTGVNPIHDWIVEEWPIGMEEPPERCLFLRPTGCNLPMSIRSAQCASYVCYDKLGPALAEQGLESEYKKARTKHGRALRVIQDNLTDLSFERCVEDLGAG